MANKTFSYGIGVTPMATFDSTVATGRGYQANLTDPLTHEVTANPETPTQYLRKKVMAYLQEGYQLGIVNPAVETAKNNALSNVITLI